MLPLEKGPSACHGLTPISWFNTSHFTILANFRCNSFIKLFCYARSSYRFSRTGVFLHIWSNSTTSQKKPNVHKAIKSILCVGGNCCNLFCSATFPSYQLSFIFNNEGKGYSKQTDSYVCSSANCTAHEELLDMTWEIIECEKWGWEADKAYRVPWGVGVFYRCLRGIQKEYQGLLGDRTTQEVLLPQNPLTQICYTLPFHCKMFGLCVITARRNSVITSYNFKKQTHFISQNALACSVLKMNLFYLKGFWADSWLLKLLTKGTH